MFTAVAEAATEQQNKIKKSKQQKKLMTNGQCSDQKQLLTYLFHNNYNIYIYFATKVTILI
jgi:hypothetical protein